MLTPELQNYITQSRAAGMSDDQIRQNLAAQGWKEGDVVMALKSGSSKFIHRVLIICTIFYPLAGIPAGILVVRIVLSIAFTGAVSIFFSPSFYLLLAVPLLFILDIIFMWMAYKKRRNKLAVLFALLPIPLLIYILFNFYIPAFTPTLLRTCPSGDPNQIITKAGVRKGTEYSESVISSVARTSDSDCLKTLLERGGDPNGKNYKNQPLLFSEIDFSSIDMKAAKKNIQLLLDAGADINAISAGGQYVGGKTALLYALEVGSTNHYEIAAYLIQKGADVSIKDNRSMTAANYLGKDYARVPNRGSSNQPTTEYEINRERVKELLLARGIQFSQ